MKFFSQTNEILQSHVIRTGVAPKQTDPVTAVDDTPALGGG